MQQGPAGEECFIYLFHQFRRQQRHKRLAGKLLTETWIDPDEQLEINQVESHPMDLIK
jgi:hypothetical protein